MSNSNKNTQKPGFWSRLLRERDTAVDYTGAATAPTTAEPPATPPTTPAADPRAERIAALQRELDQLRNTAQTGGTPAPAAAPTPQNPSATTGTALSPAPTATAPSNTSPQPGRWARAMNALGNAAHNAPGVAAQAVPLYKTNKPFRWAVLAASFGVIAVPYATYRVGHFLLRENGFGKIFRGTGKVLGTTRDVTLSTGMFAATATGKLLKWGAVALIGATVLNSCNDVDEGRTGNLLDAGVNNTMNTGGTVMREGAALGRFGVPLMASAYEEVKGAVSGAVTAASSCWDKGTDCLPDVGNASLDVGLETVKGAGNAWLGLWGATASWYYTQAIPNVASFAYDNTLGRLFNTAGEADAPAKTPAPAAQPATRAATPALSDKDAAAISGLISGDTAQKKTPTATARSEPALNPGAPRAVPQTTSPLYEHVSRSGEGHAYGGRRVYVCSGDFFDAKGFIPGTEELVTSHTIDAHNRAVSKTFMETRDDPGSDFYKAVMGSKTNNVLVIVPPYGGGTTTPTITTQPDKTNISVPPPATVNGATVPYRCQFWGMQDFLAGTGLRYDQIPEKSRGSVIGPR